MARNAAVFGLGGGKDVGPPMSGVRPVRLTSGVRPERMLSKSEVPEYCCGPASMAGDSGPDRRDPARSPLPLKGQANSLPDEGDAMAAMGGRMGLEGVAPLPSGDPLVLLLEPSLEEVRKCFGEERGGRTRVEGECG